MNKKVFLFVVFFILIILSAHAQSQQLSNFPAGDTLKNSNITYQLIAAPNNTWGYDIFVDQKLTIHQPNIPGKAGNKGFETKGSAKKVAEMVVAKMKKGEMLPSISVDEMKKLKAI